MAFYQILYWQNIPSQVKAWDDFDEIKLELSPKFMAMIDKVAKDKGLVDETSYLEQWKWSDEQERDGSPEEIAESVKNELEEKFD